MNCKHCNNIIEQIEGKKPRVFCSDKCRMAHNRGIKSEQPKANKSNPNTGQIKSEQPNPNITPDIKKLTREELYKKIDSYKEDTWKDSPERLELKERLKRPIKWLRERGYYIPGWKHNREYIAKHIKTPLEKD